MTKLDEDRQRRAAAYVDAMRERGHVPALDTSGEIDLYVTDGPNHYGPGCSVCGWSACMLCIGQEYDRIPSCSDETARVAALRFGWDREAAEAEERIRADERERCARVLDDAGETS